jgi:predicted ArsR family transcriptional regulator
LDDEVRRALYDYAATTETITREDAARRVGISRNLAAFHLDKLVDVGLLEAVDAPPAAGRVGRAPKCYRRTTEPVGVCVPPREPELLATILAEAIVSEAKGESAREAVRRVARQRGVGVGAKERERRRPGRLGTERALKLTAGVLAEHGFEPRRDGDGINLRNCPFHPLAASEPELVCGLNHAFVHGIVDGLGARRCLSALLQPQPEGCCVRISPR